MPSELKVRGFPVPVEIAPRKDHEDEDLRYHLRLLAEGINQAGIAAFAPKTYIKGLSADVAITGTSSGAAIELTDLQHEITTPVPATLWWDLLLRVNESGGTGSNVVAEVRINSTIYPPRSITTIAANTTQDVSTHGAFDAASSDKAFWLHPGTLYTVEVFVWKVTAGATINVLRGTEADSTLRVRVEPRILPL